MPPASQCLLEATSFRNMLAAYRRARRGKPKTPAMDRFDLRREQNLLALQRALRDFSWRPGPYREFEVRDPKPRRVAAAPFADRVVHHVLMAALEPRLEPVLGPEVFANRRGLGSHAAIARYRQLAAGGRFALQLDVSRFFPSIDHAVLLAQLDALELPTWQSTYLRRVIAESPRPSGGDQHFPGDDLLEPLRRRRGLPLGNLTSQSLANFYLTPLDAMLRAHPDVVGFVRYVDDLAVVGRSRAGCIRVLRATRTVMDALRLQLNPYKIGIHRTTTGIKLLGFVVRPDNIRLPGKARRRFESRARQRIRQWRCGLLDSESLRAVFAGWNAHAALGMTDGALRRFYARRVPLGRRSRVALLAVERFPR